MVVQLTGAYRQALDALFARTTGATRLGLERTRALLSALGDPHLSLAVLHIAGTNGKGSVAATLEALLRGGGMRVGTYVSPHLIDFSERIRIDGRPIHASDVLAGIDRLMPMVERENATFFEATTALALDHFERSRVDAVILETGMGGRLDATNVCTPLVAGVTTIGLDHTDYLGTTIEEIAREKAGIFKPGVPAVIGEADPEVRARLAAHARSRGASAVRLVAEESALRDIVVDGTGTTFDMRLGADEQRLHTPLIGRHQAANAATALVMLDAAGGSFAVSLGDAASRLGDVRLAGRFQRTGRYLFAVAHNPDGAKVLAATIAAVAPARPRAALLCVLGDKDWRAMMDALAPQIDHFILTQAPTAPASRAWSPAAAAAHAAASGWSAELCLDFDAALVLAERAGATVVVTGSFHTVGDALVRLQGAPAAG